MRLAIVLICLDVFLIFEIGIFGFDPIFFIDVMCVVVFVLATMTMSGDTFHRLVVMLLVSGWYFAVFLFISSIVNLSLQ